MLTKQHRVGIELSQFEINLFYLPAQTAMFQKHTETPMLHLESAALFECQSPSYLTLTSM